VHYEQELALSLARAGRLSPAHGTRINTSIEPILSPTLPDTHRIHSPAVIRRPLDLLNAVVCTVLLALCLYGAATGRLVGWQVLAVRLALMLSGVLAIARLARRSALPRALAVIVELYPVALVPLVFDALGPLIPAVNPAAECGRDFWLMRADRFLLGTDPTVWLQRLVRPWLTDVMYLAYCAYFVVPFVVAGYVWRRRSPEAFRRYVFTVVLAFYVSYVGYFLVPARGPRFAMAAAHTTVPTLYTTPISRAIVNGMNAVERNKNDVFPSGHVMLTAVCLLLALRESRRLFLMLLPIGVGVLVSTVYCRYHYVIDVIAGLVLALPMPWVGERGYGRLAGNDGVVER
jgi:membrane-associated phospholipid phosphatase